MAGFEHECIEESLPHFVLIGVTFHVVTFVHEVEVVLHGGHLVARDVNHGVASRGGYDVGVDGCGHVDDTAERNGYHPGVKIVGEPLHATECVGGYE